MYDVLLHGEVRRLVCRLASHLWVPGRADGWQLKGEQVETLIVRGTGRWVWGWGRSHFRTFKAEFIAVLFDESRTLSNSDFKRTLSHFKVPFVKLLPPSITFSLRRLLGGYYYGTLFHQDSSSSFAAFPKCKRMEGRGKPVQALLTSLLITILSTKCAIEQFHKLELCMHFIAFKSQTIKRNSMLNS
eukprot:1161258-Pelagomonas_calceolata.AAC.4